MAHFTRTQRDTQTEMKLLNSYMYVLIPPSTYELYPTLPYPVIACSKRKWS